MIICVLISLVNYFTRNNFLEEHDVSKGHKIIGIANLNDICGFLHQLPYRNNKGNTNLLVWWYLFHHQAFQVYN